MKTHTADRTRKTRRRRRRRLAIVVLLSAAIAALMTYRDRSLQASSSDFVTRYGD